MIYKFPRIDLYEKIRFLIIGDGVSREKIEKKIAEDNIDNDTE